MDISFDNESIYNFNDNDLDEDLSNKIDVKESTPRDESKPSGSKLNSKIQELIN